ncbi:MAG: GNAT family N-acetyltransferase [Barnesiella sp.]|nr:GNAT family N-acetyltransferase [Barnesiella sp.]
MEQTYCREPNNELIPTHIGCRKCSLRPVMYGDVGWLKLLISEGKVAEYLLRNSSFADVMAEENDAGEAVNMAIITAEGEPAGFVSALPVIDRSPAMPRWMLEFAVAERFERRGFATEAVGALSDYLLGRFALPKVVADVCDANTGALDVVRKCGFARPESRLAYMNYRHVRQGMRYHWYRMQPGRRALYFAKGLQYYRSRRFVDAAQMWYEALAYPRCEGTPYCDSLILANIGMAYSSAGWYVQARSFLERAAVMAEDSGYIELELMWIARQTGM